jgi:hypothetical protein
MIILMTLENGLKMKSKRLLNMIIKNSLFSKTLKTRTIITRDHFSSKVDRICFWHLIKATTTSKLKRQKYQLEMA